MEWHQWNALNRQLLDEWQALLDRCAPPHSGAATHVPEPQILPHARDVMAVFEAGRGCVQLSANWERITGRGVAESLSGDFYRALAAEDVKPFIAQLQQAMCGGGNQDQGDLFPQPFRLLARSGEFRHFRLRVAETRRLPAAGGTRECLLCLLEDVHEQVLTQAALKAAERKAERAERTRVEFLNAMSHELRTPLNAILGFAQIMESGMYGTVESAKYREYLGYIRESGYELLAEIDEVMTQAREGEAGLENGFAQLARERCDAWSLIEQAAALHRPHAAEAQVVIENTVPSDAFILLIDRVKLQHALSHLIANAVRHSRAGGVVSIDAACANGEFAFSVRDEGSGMSARRVRALVAELAGECSTENSPALGMGLAQSSHYARTHGGYLTLESKAGCGTCVTLRLPAACVVKEARNILAYRRPHMLV